VQGKTLFALSASLLAGTTAFASTVPFDANHMPHTVQGKAAGTGPVRHPTNPNCLGCWPSGFTVSNLPQQTGKFPNTGMNALEAVYAVSGPTSANGSETLAQMFNSGTKTTVKTLYAGLWNFSGTGNAAGDAQLSIYNDNGAGTAPGKVPVAGCVVKPATVAPVFTAAPAPTFAPGYVNAVCVKGKLTENTNYWLVASASNTTVDGWGINVGDQITAEPFVYSFNFVGGSTGATTWYTGFTPMAAESYAVH
jgi:hypothetical protein